MSIHAPLAPSSAPEWVPCPGSIVMSAGIVQEETDDTREGDAVHWVGAKLLTGDVVTIGEIAPNGVITTEEMMDAAGIYFDVVCGDGTLPVVVETPVAMPEIHPDNWGTPDVWKFNPATLDLDLYDLKYGHASVKAEGNWQLIDYTFGILRTLTNNRPLDDLGITVNMHIIQPRCYDDLGPVRSWTIPAVDLRGYINQMEASAHEAMGPNPSTHVGDHCRYCKGRYRCPSLWQASAASADYSQVAVPQAMSVEAMAYELQVLTKAFDILKFRKEAIETEALSRILNGEYIPGYSTEQGWSNNKWSHPDAEVRAMGELMGVNLDAPLKLKTPTQAIALFKKTAIDPEVIKSYYGREAKAMKLVVDDGSKAKSIFGT